MANEKFDSVSKSLQQIFEEVVSERLYQIERWGTEADSKKNTPNDWVTYIANYSSRWMPGHFAPYSRRTLEKFRASMVKTATLAFTAIRETDAILNGYNVRDDILDKDDGYETNGASLNTKSMPSAILADRIRAKGFEVMFMEAPVIMYRNNAIEAKSYAFDQRLSFLDGFDPAEHLIFVYMLANEDGPMPVNCSDINSATKVRVATYKLV